MSEQKLCYFDNPKTKEMLTVLKIEQLLVYETDLGGKSCPLLPKYSLKP
jgi:hypothetical protein